MSRLLPALILAASTAMLGGAMIMQYVFGVLPCALCHWQRVPYVVAGLLAVAALVAPRRWVAWLVALCALAFLVNAGIAFFHVGVEHKWWAGLASCVGGEPMPETMSAEQLMAAMSKPVVRCDEPSWSLFGITLAGYNLLASLGLAAATLWAMIKLPRRYA